MQLPPKDSSPGTMARFGQYTLARVMANPHAKPLAVLAHSAQVELKARQAAYVDADDAHLAAQAAVDEVSYRALEVLTQLQFDAVAVVNRDYEDIRYRALYPLGLGHMKKQTGRELAQETNRVMAVLTAEGTDARLTQHAPALGEVLLDWKQPEQRLEATALALTLADNALEMAKEAWLDAFARLHGGLSAQFPRQKVLVDAFFPKTRARRKAKDAAVEELQAA